MIERVTASGGKLWDVIVIGGGATGVGVALDAAARGYEVLLVEQNDFGKGTSSRSTKLVHGGVRYLARGQISLVTEALKERNLLRRNAPHLVSELGFVIPAYDLWSGPYYGVGLKMYGWLAGKYGFPAARRLSREETIDLLPTIKKENLRGGVIYYDGQFDDARLLITMAETAAERGAALINYAPVIALEGTNGGAKVDRVVARDEETGREFAARARVVVNATGAFCDGVRRLIDRDAAPLIAPSQGIHLVFRRSWLPGDSALMVPRTSDGRVMFAIPWQEHTLIGTTDTPIKEATLEPRSQNQEIKFLLDTAADYFAERPTEADVLSTFAGVRPLVKAPKGSGHTAALSRDHTIHVDSSGLLTITGGKWTTYRHMAEDCVNRAAELGGLDSRPCVTADLKMHGYRPDGESGGRFSAYGSDAGALEELGRDDAGLLTPLHPALSLCEAEVIWGARREMARTAEDVLARRSRALLLDAAAALEIAPRVAAVLAAELNRSEEWQRDQVAAFRTLAEQYMISSP